MLGGQGLSSQSVDFHEAQVCFPKQQKGKVPHIPQPLLLRPVLTQGSHDTGMSEAGAWNKWEWETAGQGPLPGRHLGQSSVLPTYPPPSAM